MKGKTVSEAGQLSSYKTVLPTYWNHPAVAGITLWGYVEGSTWSSGTGILNSNGSERSAMTWLKSFMADLPDVGYPFGDKNEINTKTNYFQNKDQLVSVYPNPVISGRFVVENQSNENFTAIEVMDLQGKIVKKVNPYRSKVEIEVAHLTKGMYYLRMQTEKSLTSKKIIIL